MQTDIQLAGEPKASDSFPDASCKLSECYEESRNKPSSLAGGFLLFRPTFLRSYCPEYHRKIPPRSFDCLNCIIYFRDPLEKFCNCKVS